MYLLAQTNPLCSRINFGKSVVGMVFGATGWWLVCVGWGREAAWRRARLVGRPRLK